jgi:twitching motility protein PilT
MNVISLLQLAKSRGASDVHLVVSRPPVLRVDGLLQPIEDQPLLKVADLEEAFRQITSEEERARFKKHPELDFSYDVPDDLRVRCSAALQRRTLSLALRLIPRMVPKLDELNLPEACRQLVTRPRGMVVISGPTGSGKSTTLAAMIDYLNHSQSLRIITIEDPIEFIYTDDKCIISQRQIGDDTESYADALKHVLRHDPNVILVGEMRDTETVAAALTMAETGHLVLTTGHAPSASQTIERMIDLFPPHEQHLVQTRLASLIIGIICQTLVPYAAGPGRLPAAEVMLANAAIRNLIRDGKIYQLNNTIRSNSQDGMQLMDHALINLYNRKMITVETLLATCNDRSEIERLCGGILAR